MNRSTIYSGEVPRTIDFLQAQQNAMVADAKLIEATIGTGGFVYGLACTPGAGLTVSLAGGQVFQPASLEASTWSALAADTSDQIVKQGIALAAQIITLTPPATGGFSQVFLVEVQYADLDTSSVVLPYYNSANPSAPFSGPGNSGTPQNTARNGIVSVQIKAGIAATTGTQVAPTVDSGFIGLWLVTLANGAVSISSGNIVQVANAPFLGAAYMPKLPALPAYIQSGAWGACTDTGAANGITVAPVPPPAAIAFGTKLTVKMAATTTGATTMAVTLANGSVNTSPVVHGDLSALLAGDLVTAQMVEFNFDGANWQMPRASASVSANQMTASSVGFNAPINCSISAAIASGALTVTINGANGAALSTSNPMLATFRSATIGSGVPVTRTVISSPTFTVNSGNTLGSVSGVPQRFRVVLIDNAGTVLVGLINCLGQSSGVQLFPLNETGLNATGTGTGAGNNAGVIYTSVASLSGLAIREIGFLEWSTALTTAGTYNNLPNEIQLAGPGYKRAGDTVARYYTQNGAGSSTTNTYVLSATAPTAAGGAQAATTGSINATSPANVWRVRGQAHLTSSGSSNYMTTYIIQGAGGSALSAGSAFGATALTSTVQIGASYEGVTGSVSTTSFQTYYSGNGGTTYVNENGTGGTGPMPASISTFIEAEEIMA